MSLRVCEIFKSVQGESSHAGRPCAFVRLSGCNLRCRYCDTTYAYEGGTVMALDDVVTAVLELGAPLVELTGGEPLLQEEAPELAARLAAAGRSVLVETNGSLDIGLLGADIIKIVDVKGPSSGETGSFLPGNLERLGPRDELKFVLADQEDFTFLRTFLAKHGPALAGHTVNASPLFGKLPPARLAEWILASGLDLRLNLQLHKHIWSPEARGV